MALPSPRISTTDLTFHFIDVGQGNCILIECPGGGLVLDDCGSIKLAMPPLRTHLLLDTYIRKYTETLPFVAQPLAVIATHPDRDHFDLIASKRYMIDPRAVYRVIVSETLADYSDEFSAWAEATGAVETFPANAHGPLNGVQCGLAQVDLLTINASEAPRQPPPVSQTNADSAVVAIRYNGFTAVLPGDAEGPTQDLVLKNYPGLHATLLAAPHHGADSAGSNSPGWAKALRPQIVVFSAALENRFHHPRRDSVEAYLARPSLRPARAHRIDFYDDKSGLTARIVDKAIYTTGLAGTLDVTVDATGFITVTCAKEGSQGC